MKAEAIDAWVPSAHRRGQGLLTARWKYALSRGVHGYARKIVGTTYQRLVRLTPQKVKKINTLYLSCGMVEQPEAAAMLGGLCVCLALEHGDEPGESFVCLC